MMSQSGVGEKEDGSSKRETRPGPKEAKVTAKVTKKTREDKGGSKKVKQKTKHRKEEKQETEEKEKKEEEKEEKEEKEGKEGREEKDRKIGKKGKKGKKEKDRLKEKKEEKVESKSMKEKATKIANHMLEKNLAKATDRKGKTHRMPNERSQASLPTPFQEGGQFLLLSTEKEMLAGSCHHRGHLARR